MFIIEKNITNEINIKNSKFITILKKIQTKDEVKETLEQIKKIYPKASHYCYAYIIKEEKKSSDDKEPNNTAGLPILNALESQNLNFTLAVVVRYFGGIKLGTGGLIRAYKKSVHETIKKTSLIELTAAKRIIISFSYQDEKKINHILSKSKIINKEFKEKITYEVIIEDKELEKIRNYNYEIVEDTYIEKNY